MKYLTHFIPIFALAVAGCAGPLALGPVVDDPARRTSLLRVCERSDPARAVFQTVVRWPGTALSLTEIVKHHPGGGYSVAGVADVGKTLYAARVRADGRGRIISKSLPFSDRWLLEGFVAELLVPWTQPDESSELHELADGTFALVQKEGRLNHVYLFDASERWVGYRRLSGTRLRYRVLLEWGEGPLPATMRVENVQKHYRAVRENVTPQ